LLVLFFKKELLSYILGTKLLAKHPRGVTAPATWIIVVIATLGVIVRPFGLPEALWAVAGALVLVDAGLLPPAEAWHGVVRGTDVYLFLVGMMLLAELARVEGLFDWLAARAARRAGGSPVRLFTLIYLVGVLVTVFLSNDATAVVLTPAVAAAARAAKVSDPLPYVLICAFVANAASFVLPISNPANQVIFGSHMPLLADWLRHFGVASAAAIVATFGVLRLTQRAALRQAVAHAVEQPRLSVAGWIAAASLVATAGVLMLASARGSDLGMPTFLAGFAACLVVLLASRRAPWGLLRDISWGVIPLVAGLFVLVQALAHTGVLAALAQILDATTKRSVGATAWGAGIALGVLCNLTNNLPAGLIAGGAVQAAHAPPLVTGAVLIGVDVGPNLSVTGSLATILWLSVLRRDGIDIGFGKFLAQGACVMPPALLLALGALLAGG
jgi:arsenical pump membrane protein